MNIVSKFIIVSFAFLLTACYDDIFKQGQAVSARISRDPNNPCQLIVTTMSANVTPDIPAGTAFVVTINKCVPTNLKE